MAKELPNFRAPQLAEMRTMWLRYENSDPDAQRLLLEIVHLRDVLQEIERLRAAIDRTWKADVGGQLVGLENLRSLLQRERNRIGLLAATAQERGRER
jgi:hypothetical protein